MSSLLHSRSTRHLRGCGGVGLDFRFTRAVDQRGSAELVAGPAMMQKPRPVLRDASAHDEIWTTAQTVSADVVVASGTSILGTGWTPTGQPALLRFDQ
jgi:hypothetical protein